MVMSFFFEFKIFAAIHSIDNLIKKENQKIQKIVRNLQNKPNKNMFIAF